MAYTILAEWLDANQHRVFPLEDSMSSYDVTNTFKIPTSFMVDLFLCAPPDADTASFYVKSLVVRRYTVDVEIGYAGQGLDITAGRFTKIPIDQATNSIYYFEPAPQPLTANQEFSLMTGVLVIGSTDDIKEHPGFWEFQPQDTSFLATRIVTGLAGVTSVLVGERLLNGKIALKEGAGITITPHYEPARDQTVITIKADLSSLADVDIPLVSDAAIIANLTALYGQPITTINGIPPSSDGSFLLNPLDCTELEPIEGGLRIENPCSLPCCDKSVLDDAYTSISELNLRYARMEGYYQSIGRNINDLQSRMIALEI